MNHFVQPACLPTKYSYNYPMANTKVYAAGWGQLFSYGKSSNTLQNVEINVNNGTACYRYPDISWDSLICAAELDGGKGTCEGDTGGPIYLKETINGTVRHFLVGITFNDYECGDDYYSSAR